MAKTMTTKATLQISTEDAIKQIEALSAKLAELKQTYCSDPKALAIKLSVDTSQLTKVNNGLNGLYNNFQKKAAETQSRISTNTTKSLANQKNAYQQFWENNLTQAEKYSQKMNEIKLQSQQKNGIPGYNVMNNKQREAALNRSLPSYNLLGNASTPDNYLAAGRIITSMQKQATAQTTSALTNYFQRQDAARLQKEQEQARAAKRESDFEKAQQLRNRANSMSYDRQQRREKERESEISSLTKQLQRELTSATKEYARETTNAQKQADRERAESARVAAAEEKAAQKEVARQKREQEHLEKQAIQDQQALIRAKIEDIQILKREFDIVFNSLQQGIQLYDSFRQVGMGVLSGIQSTANQLFNVLGLNVSTILADSVAQEEKLQMARIGFKNMFGADQVDALENKVRETAAKSPGLNSGDLADYIAQLGAVSNGADQAYNVTMGILKTVQYGGGDASGQMNYIIKNIRDVMAKGKATQVDVQQFNRAMPLLVKALEGVGQSEFLKNGQLTITKDNAKNLMSAFAALNSPDNPAYGVFNDTAKTWSGVKEEFYETTQNLVNSALREVGFYDALQDIMRNGIFPEVDKLATYFSDLFTKLSKGTDWKAVQTQIKVTWEGIKEAAKELIDGFIEAFAVINPDGTINATETIKTVIKMLGSFFEGMISGIKILVDLAGKVKNQLGDKGLTNIMSGLGWATTAGGLVSGGGSGLLNGVGGLVNLGLDLRQISLLKQANAIEMQEIGVMTKGKVGTLTGGASKLGKAASWGGSALGKLAGGAAIGGLTTAIADLIRSFHLLGDASDTASTVIGSAGGAVSGALAGSMFGAIGTVVGGLLGLAAGAAHAQAELRKIEANETGEKISEEKLKELTDITDSAAALMTEQGSKLDWASNEGKWVKDALIQEMSKMTQSELNEFVSSGKAYARFTELANMKQRQIAMSLVDNEDGFWQMGGNKAKLLVDNGDGTFSATELGARFAETIRANNMVGYDDADKLEKASAATLLQDYTQKQGLAANEVLTEAQVNYLEQRGNEIAQNVAKSTTEFSTTIDNALKESGGNIDKAIQEADKKGQEAFAALLKTYKTMVDRANQASDYMLGELEGDDIINPDTIGSMYGDSAKNAMDRWNTHTSGLNGWFDMFNLSRSSLATAFGLGDTIFDGGTFAELSTRVYKGDQELNKMIQNATGEEKETLQAVREALQANINEMNSLKEGDWGGLWDVLKRIRDMLAHYGIDITKENVTASRGGTGGWATGGFVGRQGHIVPVYRATGGSIRGVDTINAMLSPGEFVQRASAVSKAGFGVMDALNQGDLAKAYKLLGAKVNNHNNNSRSWSSVDSHNTAQQQTIINHNYGNSARAAAYHGAANFMAL